MTPEEAIAHAETMVDKNLRPGWTKRFVSPPWIDQAPKCRGCGKDPILTHIAEPKLKWAGVFGRPPAVVVYFDRGKRVLWYSYALLCERCYNRPTMNRLAVEVFAPESPEAGLPPITIETTDPSKPGSS